MRLVQDIKEFLAVYEDVLSYQEMSQKTGYSVEELQDIYDDILDSGELDELKKRVSHIQNIGVIRINPLTFEYKVYTERADITNDGFSAQDAVKACNSPDTVVSGYLWRYGSDIDLSNIEEELNKQAPNLFRPIVAENKLERARHEFDSLVVASSIGYDIQSIKKAIKDNSKYKNLYWRYM